MDERTSKQENRAKKLQVKIGEKTAYVEIISLRNHICAVEIPGHEPIFITKIRDKDDNPCWISIPQGNDDLAKSVGSYIEEYLHSNDHHGG